MNTITPLTSATNLGSATSRSGGQPPGQRNFQAGEVFKATVMEATGRDLFTLDIAGARIAAQSKALLTPGQILQLQVTSLSPQVELKIVSQTPQQFYGRSLTLLSKNIDLSSLVKTIKQAINSSNDTQVIVKEAKGNDVVTLDIGGKQIDAQSSIPLTPGQTLQVQQAVTSPQIQIAFTGGSLTLVGGETELTNIQEIFQQNNSFSSPATTRATVVEAKSPNVFILDIGGNQFTAQSKTPLVPGQVLELQEIIVSPQVKLAITPGLEQQSPATLTLTGNTTELDGLINLYQQNFPPEHAVLSHMTRSTLEDFSALQQQTLSGKDGGQILKNLVEKMGLTLENLLAKGDKDTAAQTLKAALIETAHVFKDAADISKATHQLLGTLEVYQLAQVHMESIAGLIFPLPLPFLEKGYLVVEDYGQQKAKDKDGDSPPMRFSLHLSMTDLGNIRIDLLRYQDGLYIRFNTDSKEKSNFVQSFSQDLNQALSNPKLLGLSFAEDAGDPAAELIKRILPQGSSMLDTTV